MEYKKLQDKRYSEWHTKPPYWKDYVKLLKRVDGPFLDIGCGNAWLAEHVDDYIGIDHSSAAVQLAKKKGIHVLRASADKKLPFAECSFTGVFLKDVLEHLREPVIAVSQAMRVLRPGGYIWAFVPDAQRWVWDDYTHYRPYTTKSLRQLFLDCGAQIDRISYEPIMPGIGKLCSCLKITSRPFIFWWLAKLPFMRRNVYIIARKPR